jgi:anti-anti-sigma factor
VSSQPPLDDVPHLDIEMSVEPSGARLALAGELEFATVGELEAALRRLASEHPELPVTLDLQALEFMDSSGVGALLSANQSVLGRGAQLRLVRGPQRVQRPLEVSGVDRILQFDDPA